MTEPTAESLLEQLRATHQGPDLVEVSACIVAGAKAWHRRIQEQRRDSDRHRPDGQLWAWEDLNPKDQAALVALVGPVVEAALGVLGRGPRLPVYVQADTHPPCSCCPQDGGQ